MEIEKKTTILTNKSYTKIKCKFTYANKISSHSLLVTHSITKCRKSFYNCRQISLQENTLCINWNHFITHRMYHLFGIISNQKMYQIKIVTRLFGRKKSRFAIFFFFFYIDYLASWIQSSEKSATKLSGNN